jgi:hypothetical protein
MEPLLSIVVPSRNRHYYLKFLLDYFNTVNSDKLELIVHDNSDNEDKLGSYIQSLCNSRIKYFYSSEDLSVIDNCDIALSKATGVYVTMIGDDDCFSKHIIEYLERFKAHNVDAILPIKSSYVWPDVKPRLYKDVLSGVYTATKFNFKIIKFNVEDELYKVLNKGGVEILKLPRVYHGIVKRNILEKIYKETNSYFPGPSPDIANAVALCKYINQYEIIDVPLIISGHSIFSTGGQGAQGKHFGEISKIKHLPKDTAANWTESVPFYWSGGTIYAESVIQALKRTNRIDLLKKFNYEYLIANCFVFDTNFKDRINRVNTKKNILFKLKVNYYVIWICLNRIKFHLFNNLSLLIPILNFKKTQRFKKANIMEVALLNDEMIKDYIVSGARL